METHTLAKIGAISGIIVSAIVVGALIFVFGMMLMSGSGPFGPIQEVKPDSQEEKEILNKIKQMSSVTTFKEINPEFRERFENEGGHRLQYFIQARNGDTGNVYSLYVEYRNHNQQFHESTTCQLIDTGINNNRIQDNPIRWHMDQKDLFIDSTIRDSNCLDDDFYDKYPHLVSTESN